MTDKMRTKQVKFWQISGELLNEKCTNIRIIDKLFSFVTPTIMSDFRMLTLEWCSSLYCIYMYCVCLWDHADIRAERLSIKKSQNILVLAFTNATPTKCRFLIWENRLPLIHMRQLHLGHLRVTTICSIFCSSSRDVLFKSPKMSTNYTSKVISTCSAVF